MIRQIVVDPGPRLEGRADHHRAGLERRHRHAVADQDRVAHHRRDPRPRRQDADQVERIGRRHLAQLGHRRGRAQGAQLVEGVAIASLESGELVLRAPLPPGAHVDDDLTYHPPPRPQLAPPQVALPL